MMTSSTRAGSTPARRTASRTTIAPSSVARNPFRAPMNFPVGSRTADRITASRIGSSFRSLEVTRGDFEETGSNLRIVDRCGNGFYLRGGTHY